MEFESLLIQVNEILHKSIQSYKQEIVGNSSYSDITLSQLYYLEAIYSLDNPTISTLANHLNVSNASASAGVQKLINKGLVDKIQSTDDKRVFFIHLSEDGMKLIKVEIKALSDFVANVKNSLSEKEVETVSKIFKKIIEKYPK